MAGKSKSGNNSNKSQLKFSVQSSKPPSSPKNSLKETQIRRFITTNTSLGYVLTMISLGICRRITNYQYIRRRLLIYLCLVLIGGLLNDFAPLILRSFIPKTQKTNVLNQWFVKIGWFWTTVLTFPFMTLTSVILSINKPNTESIDTTNTQTNSNNNNNINKKLTKLKLILSYLRTRQLLRLLINSLVWFISTNLFVYFEDLTGSCQSNEQGNQLKGNCIENGHKWMPGFDISGHTFLLIYSNLILIEECAVMIGWEPFGQQLFEQMKNNESQQQIEKSEQQFNLYNKYSLALRVLFVLITILSLIWDFMLVQTSMFYHTTPQKLVAAFWALSVWALTYKHIYFLLGIDVKAPKLEKNS